MSLQMDSVAHACNTISRQVRDSHKRLFIRYIVHHDGQQSEAFKVAGQDMIQHPAASTLLALLSQAKKKHESGLIGAVIARQNLFLGLTSKHTVTALCSINLDQFTSLQEVRLNAYHHAWHAINLFEQHTDPENPSLLQTEIITQHHNAMELIASNLCADVFGCVISALQDEAGIIQTTGQQRANNVLTSTVFHYPEYYPFLIAMDSTSFALQRLANKAIPKKKFVEEALTVARHIGKIYDETSLKQWFTFAKHAQEMAWKGSNKEAILSSAINISKNTSIRSIGYLVSETADIKPDSILDIRNNFTPYASNDFNEKEHKKTVTQTFETLMFESLNSGHSRAFIKQANKQNLLLSEGHSAGWCAASLQAAAKAFDRSSKKGEEPHEVTRHAFENEQTKTNWDDLISLAQKIIIRRRKGQETTLSTIIALCGDDKSLTSVQNALKITMKDPDRGELPPIQAGHMKQNPTILSARRATS